MGKAARNTPKTKAGLVKAAAARRRAFARRAGRPRQGELRLAGLQVPFVNPALPRASAPRLALADDEPTARVQVGACGRACGRVGGRGGGAAFAEREGRKRRIGPHFAAAPSRRWGGVGGGSVPQMWRRPVRTTYAEHVGVRTPCTPHHSTRSHPLRDLGVTNLLSSTSTLGPTSKAPQAGGGGPGPGGAGRPSGRRRSASLVGATGCGWWTKLSHTHASPACTCPHTPTP
jgi:hypothetical protein